MKIMQNTNYRADEDDFEPLDFAEENEVDIANNLFLMTRDWDHICSLPSSVTDHNTADARITSATNKSKENVVSKFMLSFKHDDKDETPPVRNSINTTTTTANPTSNFQGSISPSLLSSSPQVSNVPLAHLEAFNSPFSVSNDMKVDIHGADAAGDLVSSSSATFQSFQTVLDQTAGQVSPQPFHFAKFEQSPILSTTTTYDFGEAFSRRRNDEKKSINLLNKFPTPVSSNTVDIQASLLSQIRRRKEAIMNLGQHKKNVGMVQRCPQPSSLLFPNKLHEMLQCAKQYQYDDIVAFAEDGNSFEIRDRKRFVKELMPHWFQKMSTFASFHRQLNFYGFERTNVGSTGGTSIFCHELFRRDERQLLRKMQRKPRATKTKPSSPK